MRSPAYGSRRSRRFFGPNSSGKSSVLHWLLLLKQSVESTDGAKALHFGDEQSLVDLGSMRDAVFGHLESAKLEWSFTFRIPNALKLGLSRQQNHWPTTTTDEITAACTIGQRPTGAVEVREMRYALNDLEVTYGLGKNGYRLAGSDAAGFSFRRVSNGRDAAKLPPPLKHYGFPDEVFAAYENAGFLRSVQLEYEHFFRRLSYLGPNRDAPRRQYRWLGETPSDVGRFGEHAIEVVLASRERGEIVAHGTHGQKRLLDELTADWLRTLRLLSEFNVEPIGKDTTAYLVRVRQKPNSTPVLLSDVGFGVSQVLPVIVACYSAAPGSTLVLEQPDVHLHASAQAALADLMLDAVKERGIQIIVESHSEHLLRRLQRRIAEKTPATHIAIHYCRTRLDGHGSSIKELTLDEYGNFHDWPKDFFGDQFGEIAAIAKAGAKRRKQRRP